MPKRKISWRKCKKALDRLSARKRSVGRKARSSKQPVKARDPYSTKRPRGRPAKIAAGTVFGRADNHRHQLKQVWGKLETPLLAAQTVEEVQAAFENHGQPYASHFVPSQASDVLALVRDGLFPKDSDARINFLADSLGGRPNVTFRTSRDICGRERAKQRLKSPYQIIRYEYYVECSCGYKGPARDGACRKCGAEIPILVRIAWGSGFA